MKNDIAQSIAYLIFFSKKSFIFQWFINGFRYHSAKQYHMLMTLIVV